MKLTQAQAAALAESARMPIHRVIAIANDCADLTEVAERLKDTLTLEGNRVPLTEGASRVGASTLQNRAAGFESFGDFLVGNSGTGNSGTDY